MPSPHQRADRVPARTARSLRPSGGVEPRRCGARAGRVGTFGVVAACCVGAGLLYVGFRVGTATLGGDPGADVPALAPEATVASPAGEDAWLPAAGQAEGSGTRSNPAGSAPPPETEADPATPTTATDPSGARAAEAAQGMRVDPEERARLMRAMRPGEDPGTRLATAREVLAERETGPLVIHALQVLSELAPGEVAGEIERRLTGDFADPRASEMMAMVVGMLGRNEAALDAATLERLYDQGDPKMQLSAAQALEHRGEDRLLLRYRDRCREDLAAEDPLVRAEAVRQLGSARAPDTLPLVAPMLQDPDERIRLQALRAVSQLADVDTAIGYLRELTSDPSDGVRATAERLLRSLELRASARR